MSARSAPDASRQSRESLRSELRSRRQTVTGHRRRRAQLLITEHCLALVESCGARHVATYAALDGEADLAALAGVLMSVGCRVYLPRMQGKQLSFHRVGAKTPLRKNRHGIPEPVFSPSRPARLLDLVFVPLVAFDTQRLRLGYGGGYYDRCFAYKTEQPGRPPLLCGVALACQQVESIEKQVWDVRLDAVITERGIL